NLHMESDRTVNAFHNVFSRRIAEHEGRGYRNHEGPVHDATRAILVGQVPTVGAENARRHRVQRPNHAGGSNIQSIDADQVARQPERECDERAEYEEIVERKAPYLHILERLKFEPSAL